MKSSEFQAIWFSHFLRILEPEGFSISHLCTRMINSVYVMANVESRLKLSLAPNSQFSTLASNFGANVESSEKLIIRVEFLLVS